MTAAVATVRYDKGKMLGEGTWGSVYEAVRKGDELLVAIKRIKPMDRGLQLGMNFTALREIKYLKQLKVPNVIELHESFVSGGLLHLVLEYCPFDLEKVIRDKNILLRPQHVKCYMKMLLQGVYECHRRFILHRDLKPANLLFGRDGQLKLADFGLARYHSSPVAMTCEVVTLWYRSPELLFGANHYSVGVDVWAAGCIFAELLFRVPLFPGESDIEQLGKIFNLLGTPNPEDWSHVEYLPKYVCFETRQPMNMQQLFRNRNSTAGDRSTYPPELDLLLRMLALNPNKRCSIDEALRHHYFSNSPTACEAEQLPLPTGVDRSLMQFGRGKNESGEKTAATVEEQMRKRQRTAL